MLLVLLLIASLLSCSTSASPSSRLDLHVLRRLASSSSSSSTPNSSLAIEDPNPDDGYTCDFEMFEAMGVCNTLDYKSCCTSVKTALYGGCLCTTVFQDYIRYCIQVTRELNDYLDQNCVPDQSKIDQVLCYRNLTYHERHDPSVYSICPLVSLSPSSSPDPDDRVSPWEWFWNTSGTLPPPPPAEATSSPPSGNPAAPGDDQSGQRQGQSVAGSGQDPLSDTTTPPAAWSSSFSSFAIPPARLLLFLFCVVAL